jgi:hypothetical protein
VLRVVHGVTALLMLVSVGAAPPPDPVAVREVQAGMRDVADATWWGFDPVNATAALQGAISSGARRVIVPNVGADWLVEPISLESDQEIVFEEGVVITAREGAFPGTGDCLFRADRKRNITLRGYGATLRMRKAEYTEGEWRMALSLRSCTNVKILGLTLRDSGGDGIYIGNADPEQPYCRDILIRDCVCDNHRRQGLSVITAENLLVERCAFRNTNGTAPEAGVDLEPNLPGERLINCVFRDCVMEGNTGPGILCYFGPLSNETLPVSARFERCRVTSATGVGIMLGGTRSPGPTGEVVFRDCLIEDCAHVGLNLSTWAADAVAARFEWCTWRNVANGDLDLAPMQLENWDHSVERVIGGAEFSYCRIEDLWNRPAILALPSVAPWGVGDLRGGMTIRNPYGARVALGDTVRDVMLTLDDELAG